MGKEDLAVMEARIVKAMKELGYRHVVCSNMSDNTRTILVARNDQENEAEINITVPD